MFTIELQREICTTNKVDSALCSGVFTYFLSFYPLDSPCEGRHPPPPHFKMRTLEFQGFPHSQWVSWDSPCCLVSLSVQLSQPHLIFQPYAGHRIFCRTAMKSISSAIGTSPVMMFHCNLMLALGIDLGLPDHIKPGPEYLLLKKMYT